MNDTQTLNRAPQRARPSRRNRALGVNLALAAGVLVVFAASVMLGRYPVTPTQLMSILSGVNVPGLSFIVLEDRLPAAALGLLAGAALGLSGAIFQSLLRNPLASPDVIGIGYGASAAAVTGMLAFGWQGPGLMLAAFVGALIVAVLILALADSGKHTGARLILAGIGMAALLQALIQYLMTRTDVNSAADALRWLTGSLNSATWDVVLLLGIGLAVVLPLLLPAASRLRILALGDDTAAGLGVSVGPARLWLVILGVALCAMATAVTGPIAFVAFLAGPVARRLHGGRTALAGAALTGALLVLGAGFLADNAFGGTSLPVGVVTGALGAPFLLLLLVRTNKQGNGG